ncbi:MAG TPA: hypothetical protein VGB83_01775 [Actinomycetota bacterium]
MTDERPPTIIVRDGEHGLPFSKGLTANTIIASGLSPARAYHVAQDAEERLRAEGRTTIEAAELRGIVADVLRAVAGERYADAYEKWQAIGTLDVPLVVLIGGGTGVGKSTIATNLAARLSILRVSSTDAIREVMRGTIARAFMPTLYTSSFNADQVVASRVGRDEDAVIVGFREQVQAVAVGVNALVHRAVTESTDVIIEGAHIVPGFLDTAHFGDNAVIVPIIIEVEDEELHRSHFFARTHDTRQRPVERYLAHFDNIRGVQRYIKSHALRHGVPIIPNFDLDICLREVMDLIVNRATDAASRRAPLRAISGGNA